MIWSMKTAQAEHSTEFGLFEQNLTSLVKAGKYNSGTSTESNITLISFVYSFFKKKTEIQLDSQSIKSIQNCATFLYSILVLNFNLFHRKMYSCET